MWTDEKYTCDDCKHAEYYKHRNCKKYFPRQPQNKEYKWEPTFYTARETPFFVENVECDECPVSYVTAASRHLIQIEIQNQILHESTGAAIYGPDLSKWPSRTVDAFTRLASIRNEYEAESHKAQVSERS